MGNQLKAKQEAQALKDAQALEALQALSSSMGAMRGLNEGVEEGVGGGLDNYYDSARGVIPMPDDSGTRECCGCLWLLLVVAVCGCFGL